jgi:predicted metal-binding membrane protein
MLQLSRATGMFPRGSVAARDIFYGLMALLFAASTAVTVLWGLSMDSMGEIPMPGGWTLSMAWMPMCGQTWSGATISFLGMWMVMMVAMMLPSLTPVLWRYHQAAGAARLTALMGAGYLCVWAMVGLAVFSLGAALAEVAQQSPDLARAVPLAGSAVVLLAGALQFSPWKARHLACCRAESVRGYPLPAGAGMAWRHGLRLGLHCSQGSAGLTATLLVIGVMDLRAMAVITLATTLERLAPGGLRIVHGTGIVIVAAGLLLMVRAGGIG